MAAARKKEPRAQRSDGARNRELLLEAAEAEFAEHGIDASVADITRRAGVAKGTFFRHFATKDELITAIVEPHIIELAELGERLGNGRDPGASLLAFLTDAAAQRQQHDVSFLFRAGASIPRIAELRDRFYAAMERLVSRAQESGVIRRDVTSTDVVLLMCAPDHIAEFLPDAEPELWRRYLAIIFDGLRPAGAHPLPRPAPVTRP